MIGSWQIAGPEQLKAFEDAQTANVVCVKVMPRQYDAPTIPYADFSVQVNVLTRAEVDENGESWFTATEIVQNVLQRWQADFHAM